MTEQRPMWLAEQRGFLGAVAAGLLGVCWLAVSVAPVAAAEPAADYAARVRPLLEKFCFDCHSGGQPEADLDLAGFRTPQDLVRNRKRWDSVLRVLRSGEMPPEGNTAPNADGRETLIREIEAVFIEADRNVERDPGRVTVRRLNRVEYRNTVRDLVGVDFNPAESFPSDDIGHGFDNIGDVLTLSPVLMERYLAAAESIMQRAILPDPPAPPQRHLSAKYTEPAGRDVPQDRFRPISTEASDSPIRTGPLFTGYQFQAEDEYVFRARVWAESAGGDPVRVAVLACGKQLERDVTDGQAAELSGLAVKGLRPFVILKTIEIRANSEATAEVIEVPVPPMPGRERIALAIVKPPEGKPAATLHVEYFALQGPLDTRPVSHRRLLACDAGKPQAEQTREIVRRFASQAYRRPATEAEIQRLTDLVAAAQADGEKWEAAIQLALQAVLVSPKFLFRVELDDRPASAEIRPLDEYHLASRLSYFLWSTMPDAELFELAAKKQLTAQLENQVRRMLLDPKSSQLVENFAMQWLQLQRLESFEPDPKLFPSFDEALRAAMLDESKQFFEAVMREDRSILDLIDADFTFLNERLAKHYGIVDTVGTLSGQKPAEPGGQPIRGNPWVRVSLAGQQRGGLLTQASVLTVTSNPTRTSPVKRGRWVLEQILGTPPLPAPPNVPELAEGEQATLSGSLRQRMEQHRANPACANCHARMDPLGFAFENYDAIGRFRTHDGPFPIDPAGELPDGKAFQGAGDLKVILKDKRELFARCLTEKMLIYALGRGLEYYDRPTVDRIVAALAANEDRFSTLVIEIAKSDPFRFRRGG
jgi:hypothetical protein